MENTQSTIKETQDKSILIIEDDETLRGTLAYNLV
jgi:hypothetical protein